MSTYQALTIVAPSGTKIARGEKTLEVRRWTPEELPLRDLLIIENDRYLTEPGQTDPNGRAVALVDVVEVSDWRRDQVSAACASYWEDGWMAWRLENVRRVRHDGPLIAARKIYEIRATLEIHV
jgi:hypothetical protein